MVVARAFIFPVALIFLPAVGRQEPSSTVSDALVSTQTSNVDPATGVRGTTIDESQNLRECLVCCFKHTEGEDPFYSQKVEMLECYSSKLACGYRHGGMLKIQDITCCKGGC